MLTHKQSHGSKPFIFLGIHLGIVIPPAHLYLHSRRVNSSLQKTSMHKCSSHSSSTGEKTGGEFIHCRKDRTRVCAQGFSFVLQIWSRYLQNPVHLFQAGSSVVTSKPLHYPLTGTKRCLQTHKIDHFTAYACEHTTFNAVRSQLLRFSAFPVRLVDHNANASLLRLLLGWKTEREHGNATPNGPTLEQFNIFFAFDNFRARSLLNSQFTDILELALCSIRACSPACTGLNSY